MSTTQPETIGFDFFDLSDMGAQLSNLRIHVPHTKRTSKHLDPLIHFAEQNNVKENALALAKELANGYGDLLIVLLEPTNIFSSLTPDEVFRTSGTLQHVDHILRDSTKGTRTLENTCIFDVRPFRSKSVRQGSAEEVDAGDESAYGVFQEMVNALRPLVILTCQCQTANVKNPTARLLSSSIQSGGHMSIRGINNYQALVVDAFHPSMFRPDYLQQHATEHGIDEAQMRVREVFLQGLFRFTILKAINALVGRRIVGLGELDLSRAVSSEPRPATRSENGRTVVLWKTQRLKDVNWSDAFRSLAVRKTQVTMLHNY